jgi:hypothetical protein
MITELRRNLCILRHARVHLEDAFFFLLYCYDITAEVLFSRALDDDTYYTPSMSVMITVPGGFATLEMVAWWRNFTIMTCCLPSGAF